MAAPASRKSCAKPAGGVDPCMQLAQGLAIGALSMGAKAWSSLLYALHHRSRNHCQLLLLCKVWRTVVGNMRTRPSRVLASLWMFIHVGQLLLHRPGEYVCARQPRGAACYQITLCPAAACRAAAAPAAATAMPWRGLGGFGNDRGLGGCGWCGPCICAARTECNETGRGEAFRHSS